MAKANPSLLRRLLKGIPIPILALLFGLVTGLAVWVYLDRTQTRVLAEIFGEELENQLHQRAREGLIRFDQYQQSYVTVIRLLANHRRLAAYLGTPRWDSDGGEVYRYEHQPPPWLPDDDVWSGVIQPSHLLLIDRQGRVREEYRLRGQAVPAELMRDPSQFLTARHRQSRLTKLDGQPYLVISEMVEDPAGAVTGWLMLLVPVDSQFLGASQQRVGSADAVVALVDADTALVLSSSDAARLPQGARLAEFERDFVVTAQSFFDYDDSDLNLLFATLVPRAGIEATGQRVLDLERRQRLTGAGGTGEAGNSPLRPFFMCS